MRKITVKDVHPTLAWNIRAWLNTLPPTKRGKSPWRWSAQHGKIIFVRSLDALEFKLKFPA